MAIKAKTSITLSQAIDIESTKYFYKTQSSTIQTYPAAPTTYEPSTASGWVADEPSYDPGSTLTLYFVIRTTYTNHTASVPSYSYSDVTKSSSYEAAKTAYNLADSAKTDATDAKATAEDISSAIYGIQATDGDGNLIWTLTVGTTEYEVKLDNVGYYYLNGTTKVYLTSEQVELIEPILEGGMENNIHEISDTVDEITIKTSELSEDADDLEGRYNRTVHDVETQNTSITNLQTLTDGMREQISNLDFVNIYKYFIDLDYELGKMILGKIIQTDSGAVQNVSKLSIDAENITFSVNGQNAFTYITNEAFRSKDISFQNLMPRFIQNGVPIGNLTWTARDNGHFSLKAIKNT